MLPRCEPAEWKPFLSKRTLEAMIPGDCIRIYHFDLSCGVKSDKGNKGNCSLGTYMTRLKKLKGWRFESYHEKQGIAVVRRLA